MSSRNLCWRFTIVLKEAMVQCTEFYCAGTVRSLCGSSAENRCVGW
jgi:hypothetical protein